MTSSFNNQFVFSQIFMSLYIPHSKLTNDYQRKKYIPFSIIKYIIELLKIRNVYPIIFNKLIHNDH